MFLELLEDYLLLNLGRYFPGADFPVTIFLLSLAVGICIACVFTTIHRRNMAYLIKSLTRYTAYDESSAKTLAELKIKVGFFLRGSLSRRGQITSLVGCVGGYPFERADKGRLDFATAKFYIKDKSSMRSIRISESTPPSYFNTALGCVLVLMIFITLSLFMPRILELLTGM